MKKFLMIAFVIVLVNTFLCLPANAKNNKIEKVEQLTSQDMLIKCEVETAVSMLQAIYKKYQNKEMTLKQAKKLGADLLRELKYGSDGYFWADTTKGVNVVLYGKKDVEGKNRLEAKDKKGNFYIKDFIKKGMSGGGFLDYWFPKKNQKKALRKRSYALLFKPFGWIIGTGYYR